MTTKTTTRKNTPKTGTKGSASRKTNKTKMGNTRAIDDSFVAPKKSRKAPEEVVTLAQALAESGETMEQLKAESKAKPAAERTVGTSNLACTIRNRRKQYAVALGLNGKKTQTCGDTVATILLGIPLAELTAFVGSKEPGTEYAHLNPGHQRMCLGNKVRGWVSKGDGDTIEWLNKDRADKGQSA